MKHVLPFVSFGRKVSSTWSRGALLALLFVFTIMSSPGLLLAQESTAQQPPSPVSAPSVQNEASSQTHEPSTLPDSAVVPDAKVSKPDFPEKGILGDETSPEAQSMSASTQIGSAPPALSESNTLIRLGVDEQSGAFVYEYPINVPPGRNGLQPTVKLSYTSQGSDSIGIFGSDQWSVSIPYIERANKWGTNQLYTTSFFYSSISGELATTTTAGEFRAKSDSGDFIKYTLSGNTWTVLDKKGTQYKFGTTAGSRQDNPNDTTKVFKWMLEEIRDTNDNYIKFEYYKDGGQIYPWKITYTGNGIVDGIFQVEFLRQTRTDVGTSYRPGFLVQTNYRINEIQTKISGLWARKYVLAYITADNSRTSLLRSITESGQDELSNITTLPATTFDYSTANTGSAGSGWSGSGYGSPIDIRQGVEMVDVNGDALPDLVKFYIISGQEYKGVYLNDGNGGFVLASYNSPVCIEFEVQAEQRDCGTRFVELNGDGLIDILNYASLNDRRSFINNGSGWTETDIWDPPSNFSFAHPDGTWQSGVYSAFLVDLNGDGLTDLFREISGQGTIAYLNNGNGWTAGWDGISGLDVREGVAVAELNGDGLPDLLQYYDFTYTTDKVGAWVNNGTGGWIFTPTLNPPVPFQWDDGSGIHDSGTRVMDVNGDGLSDVVQAHDGGVYLSYLNTGNGWLQTTVWQPPTPFARNDGIFYGGGYQTFFTDYVGLGLSGIFRKTTNNAFYKNAKTRADMVTKVTHFTGGTTDVVYKPSAQHKNGTTLLNPDLPFVIDTVYQKIDSDPVRSLVSTVTHSYEGGEYYFENPLNRKFAGFHITTNTNSAGNVTKTYNHQGNATNSSLGEYADHVSKIGKPYRVETLNNIGSVYSKTISKWENVDLGQQRNFVKLTQSIEMGYDGDADHRDTATTFTYDNTNGNLTQKKAWGEVTGNDNGTFTDTGSDIFTTDVQYASNIGAYIIGLSKQETTTDQGAAKVAETKYYYDLQVLGTVTDGNETKREMWVTGTTYIDVEKTYNTTYGIVTQEKDPRDKATNYSYDANNFYPATVTNPLNQSTQYTYDYSSGKVKQTTDPNTRVFQTNYDGLDRVIEEKQPDKTTQATLVTSATYSYNDSSSPRSVTKVSYLDATLTNDSVTYLDGFDRTIQTRSRAEDANTYSVKDIAYDNLGHVQKESLPYFATGTGYSLPTTNQSLFTVYSYDPLDRVLTSVNTVGTTSHAYDQWKETVTDAKNKVKDYTSDAYGNLVKVEEHDGASVYTTNYIYNGLRKLTNITDALGNVRNFTYDGLGRRLTAQDLHTPTDGTFGTWAYTYDNSGNLTTQLDPKSQTVNYTYDDMNRVLTEDFTGQAGVEKTYAYDTGTNGIGRLASVAFTTSGGSGGPANLLLNPGFETTTPLDNDYHAWKAEPTSGSSFVEYTTVNPIAGNQSLRIVKAAQVSANVRQYIDVEAGKNYVFKATLKNEAGISGSPYIDNYQIGGCWCNQGLWWNQPLTPGIQQVEAYFTPSVTGAVAFQFVWNGVVGETRIDNVEITEVGGGGGSSSTVTTAYIYNPVGEIASETKTIDSTNYVTSHSYDRQGNRTNIVYPDTSEVKYTYNSAGLTETVQKKDAGGSFTNVVSDFDYSPLGQITYQANANGTATTNTYDQNELYRLKHKVTTAPGGGSGNQSPTAPTSLFTEGATNPTAVIDTTPEFSSIYQDPDSGDLATHYRIQVTNTQGNWTTPVWDSGKTALGTSIIAGTRSPDISYAGSTLSLDGSSYWWRMKYWDDSDAEGAWSTGNDFFTMDNQSSSNLLYNPNFESPDALDQGNYHRWGATPLSGSNFVEYTTTNPIEGTRSLRIVKAGTGVQTSVVQTVEVQQGINYTFKATLSNSSGVSGSPYIDNYQVGGCWCNQGLWWNQPLTAGTQLIEVNFTPYVTGQVAFQFRWDNAIGETRIDNVEVIESGNGGYAAEAELSLAEWSPVPSQLVGTGAGGSAWSPSLRYIPGMPYQYDENGDVKKVVPPLHKKTLQALKKKYPSKSFTGLTTPIVSEGVVTAAMVSQQSYQVPEGEGLVYAALGENLIYNPYFESPDALDQGDYHRWGAEPLTGATFVEYTTTNPIQGTRSLRVVKADQSTTTSIRQIIEVEAGKNYVFRATLNNASGISGSPYIDNYQAGGCWCNQGLWWSQALTAGTQQIETYFTPSVTGSVVFQFRWDNALGETRIDNVEVIDQSGGGSTPPTADFSANPLSGTSPLTVTFTDQSTQGTNPITSWAWDIDNNGTTDYTSQNPQHTYSSAGTYSVKLTVSDGALNDSETKLNYITVSTPPSGPSVIQDLTYTYDAVGNITQIVDASQTSTGKTTTYTYDDLHRLLSSTISNAANGDNTGRTYSYNAIGNILTASDQGTYLYEGTNYANPHATTKVGSAVYAYDNNGNLTSDSVWSNTWDYDNRLTQSQKTGSTVTYQYDHAGQRTKYSNGTKTIRYANKLYNTDGTTPTKHIFAGDQLVATIEGASTLQYVHTDHLTGSNVATNNSGGMVQLLDYYPYGAMRIDQTTTFDEQRKNFGHEFDRSTNLTYANARYYKQDIGRFLSQDPVFIRTNFRLEDPQSMNSYAYSRNNPLKYVDPNGEDFMPFQSLFNFARNNPNSSINAELRGIANSANSLANTAKTILDFTPAGDISVLATGQTLTGDKASALDYGLAGLGVVTLGASTEVKAGIKGVDKAIDATKAASKLGSGTAGYKVYQSIQNGAAEYVGITNSLERRAAEHLRNSNRIIEGIKGLPDLTRNQARGVEQYLIEKVGISNLSNKINSIAKDNPIYSAAKSFGESIIKNLNK